MSGLELLGGVSAAFGLAQTGFSLAKAIRESDKDYKDARDDIAGLARVIESTLSRVAEVQGLINDNNKTKVFSDNGINTIKNSFVDLERIVRDLVKLLTTAGVPEDTRKTIRPEDVAVTRFQKVGWISLKSEVKEKKEELSNIQIDLTLAIICAQARSTVSPTIVAALRLRVVDLEMQRRQHALNGSAHMTGKPDTVQSTTNNPSGQSPAPIPPARGSPPASSPASSVQSVTLLPNGNGGVPLGGNTEPGPVDPTLCLNMQQIAPHPVENPTGHQQSTDTSRLPADGDAEQPAKDKDEPQQPSDQTHRVQYAYLLVVDGADLFVTPLLTPKHPKRLSRADPRATAQVWAALSQEVREEIASTLDSKFPLPRGYGWHLASARDAATPPSWKRTLARLLHIYEDQANQRYTQSSDRCYMVLFVSSRMFNEETVSDSSQTQAPAAVYDHIDKEGETPSTVSSDDAPRVRNSKRHGQPVRPPRTVRGRQLHVGLTEGLSRMTVASSMPQHKRSDVSSSSSGTSRSRVRRDASSASWGSSRSRDYRHDRKRLEREKREFVEARKLGEEIQVQGKGKAAIEYYRPPHHTDDEKREIEREIERKQFLEEHERRKHETAKKNMEEERRTLELIERRKREEAEEERRVMEKIERRKFEAKEKERHQWAKFEEMKAKEAAEKKEAEKKIEEALRQRLVEAALPPAEIEKIMNKDASERKQHQQQQSISIPIMAERTPEEEAQLFNDAMLRFTGRML